MKLARSLEQSIKFQPIISRIGYQVTMMLTLVKVTMDHVAMNWTFGKQTLSALPTQTTLVKLQVQVLYIMMNNVKDLYI